MRYYVNKNAQSNGDHEVHNENCNHLPDAVNQKYLGDFSNCEDAVKAAKVDNAKADGCYFCSRACHTR